ncbi:MAG: enoyl-CoA hydratase/isomerase family protein, partial [Deltaproteobacteria bacterium]|nr:enoyl-CoA hydratase/isomerase family protein [Deltaproteobacteria bacterium]
MTYKTIMYKKEGKLGIITLNRPEVLNALNGEM